MTFGVMNELGDQYKEKRGTKRSPGTSGLQYCDRSEGEGQYNGVDTRVFRRIHEEFFSKTR